MITITLKPARGATLKLNNAFRHIAKVSGDFGMQAIELGLEEWETEINRIFTMEGDPKWKGLKGRTIRERSILGEGRYGPAHPILQRQRFLIRGLYDRTFPAQVRAVEFVNPLGQPDVTPMMTGNVWDMRQPTPGHLILGVGTADARFRTLHEGRGNTPARPMVPDTESQKKNLGMKIEDRLLRLMNKMAVP